MSLDGMSMSDTSNLDDTIIISKDDISNYNPSQILPLSAINLAQVRKWLQPTEYNIPGGEYRKHVASHMPGTGRWLLSSGIYKQWLNSNDNGLLWIKGIPGSGKSVIAASVIKELTTNLNPRYIVLFFFFRQIIDANHNPATLIRDWMDQVLDYSPPLQQQLYNYVETHRSLESVTSEDMWKHLKMAFVNLPSNVVCVADALDEMDRGNDEFLERLAELGHWRPKKVKVLVTSRPVPLDPLQRASCLHLRLAEDLVDNDISLYVRNKLTHSQISQAHWQAITNAVPGRANGLFLYARLAMDAFLEPSAVISEVISQLPADLDVLYTNLLKEHARRSGVDDALQRLILQTITHASRPLRLLELAEMIKFNSPSTFTDIKTTKGLVKAACGPLLEILADDTVSVIHHSFTEYLRGTRRPRSNSEYSVLEYGPTHAQLALMCLRYLEGGSLDGIPSSCISLDVKDPNFPAVCDMAGTYVSPEEISLRLQYPFFAYASTNWSDHVNKFESAGCDHPEVTAEIQNLLGNDHWLKAWVYCKWPTFEPYKKLVLPAHVAGRLGLVAFTKHLIKTTKLDVIDGSSRTPLWWAAFEGKVAVVRELVAAGANADYAPSDGIGHKPLHAASRRNHYKVVEALLEAGVDPLTEPARGRHGGHQDGNKRKLALMFACESGHLETVNSFVAVVDNMDILQEALAWAAEHVRHRVVARLLEQPGIDVNCKVDGNTALFLACVYESVPTACVLLQAGADPSIHCKGVMNRGTGNKTGLTCLHHLSSIPNHIHDRPGRTADFTPIISLLLKAGADVNQRCLSGETPLHGAFTSPVVTRLLLDAGADPHAVNENGQTPLHMAVSDDVVPLLIDNGHANIEAKDLYGQTPLLTMVAAKTPVAMKLLEYGPNCNAVDNQGNGALHLIQWSEDEEGKTKALEALLKAGADPNLRNNAGIVPLHNLNMSNRKVVKALLDAGADFNARDKDGKTFVFQRPSLLLSSGLSETDNLDGFEPDVLGDESLLMCDFKGRTLLHEAIRFGRKLELDALINKGLDFNAVDHNGNGLLHELAMCKQGSATRPIWEKLISLGLDISQRNHDGRTPLHMLCTSANAMTSMTPRDIEIRDFVISQMADINVADADGNTPLHITAARGEFDTKILLDAGADPAVCNHDGLTALHIASRHRGSNTVGLLLNALRKNQHEQVAANNYHEAELKPVGKRQILPAPGVNARAFYVEGKFRKLGDLTPLWYACRSGTLETVALLVEAGADPNIGNLFEACAGFEEEDRLLQCACQRGMDRLDEDVVVFKANGLSSPQGRGYNPHGHGRLNSNLSARLEGVLEILVQYGINLSKLVRQGKNPSPVDEAFRQNSFYAATCLLDVREKYLAKNNSLVEEIGFFEHMSLNLRQASTEALKRCDCIDPGNNLDIFCTILRQRQHYLIEGFVRTRFSLFAESPTYLAQLTGHGFASLLDAVVESSKAMWKDRELEEFRNKAQNASPNMGDSVTTYSNHWITKPNTLLFTAIQRELPNMKVVRLLVDKFKVNISEMYKHYVSNSQSTDSALHLVARGNHWWHVNQAMPYLLKSGADINIRDDMGRTPLHRAISGSGHSFYYKDAVETLIKAGADVNAKDNDGGTCLSYASRDLDVVKLLIQHGAVVTAGVLISSICRGNPSAVKAILSAGADPNIRTVRSTPDRDSVTEIQPYECVPLYYAGYYGYGAQLANASKIVQLLLTHGADPFATFPAYVDKLKIKKTATVLHELLSSGSFAGVYLSIPGLDVNRRDAEGRSLLHAACSGSVQPDELMDSEKFGPREVRKQVTVLQELVALGADIKARDNRGRNVIHYMIGIMQCKWSGVFKWDWDSVFKKSLTELCKMEPQLLIMADNDGKTPLHYAMTQALHWNLDGLPDYLISLGADVLAVDKVGNSVLHELAKNLFPEENQALFENLVSLGVDVNARNCLGETPLFRLSDPPITIYRPREWEQENEHSLMAMLTRIGVDFFAKDAKCRGVLHLAARWEVGRFKELMKMGLDVMLEDNAQQTPIDVAAACGNTAVLELFEKKG